jgi:predicted acylesterase/phospholipase RssA
MGHGGTDASGRRIALALSGGGHRATLWGLGALLYLVDVGKSADVVCVSSVSGGSLTNAWVGLHTDLRSVEPETFRHDVGPLAAAAATKGTLWASPLTFLYLGLMALVALATVVLSFTLTGWWVAVCWVVGLSLVGWLALQRGRVCSNAFDRALFRGASLAGLSAGVEHVICACDLQAAEQVYFSGRFVCSYRHGWGTPGDLSLARAAQASAALPGAFAVTSLPTHRHAFVSGTQSGVRTLQLTDGGVYDNMGTEWPTGVDVRNRRWAAFDPQLQVPDTLIVVNASAGLGWNERHSLRTPFVGEVSSLLAVKDVLYDQTTAVRRRALARRFWIANRQDAATSREQLLDGVMVQIDRSPFDLPGSYARGDDDTGIRARAALEVLDADERDAWSRLSAQNCAVKTNLSKLGRTQAAQLLRHAYVLTMVNTHTLLGYPLTSVPSVTDFERLIP